MSFSNIQQVCQRLKGQKVKRLINTVFNPLTFLPFYLLTLFSCTEEINLNLPSSYTRLVVEGGIGIDTCVHTVILSTTMDYFDPNPTTPYVSDAVVMITELETGLVFPLCENPTKKGHYETTPDVFGTQGYTYQLDISNVNIGGQTTYTATAFFPYIAEKIDSIKAMRGPNLLMKVFGGDTQDTTGRRMGWNLLLWAIDPPTPEYYVFITHKNGERLDDTLTRFFMVSDDIIQQTGIGLEGLPIAFFADSTWFAAQEGDTLGLEIRSISEDYYRYINEFRSVYGGSNPMFGGAPANVRGNVNGGAIGYFHAYGNRKAFVTAGSSIFY